MRLLPVLLLVAVVLGVAVAVLVWPAPEGPEPSLGQPVWHANGTVSFTDRFCGDCHYGLHRMWEATWSQPDNATWQLDVVPRYPEVSLFAVHVAPGNDAPLDAATRYDLELWAPRQPWAFDIDVPEGAGGLFARVHAQPATREGFAQLESEPNDYVTRLTLVAPDGTAHGADGPDPDLNMIAVPDPAPGTWRFEAYLVAGDLPVAAGVAFTEILAGNVTPRLSDLDVGTWTFPAGPDGEPPEVTLGLRPHHDHAPYENSDWDLYDASPFQEHFRPVQGPAPSPAGPETWNRTAIDALWGGDTERVLTERSGSFTGAYLEGGGHNDVGLGSSYPGFGLPGDPVPPGTERVRFELTWEPAVPGWDLGLRFSPHGTPYFFVPEELTRDDGAATFQTEVSPLWWEHPEQRRFYADGPVSDWDIAPTPPSGELVVHDVTWRLTVVAER
ncbi:MAG: hypothetical protein ACPGQL_10585 [Thermoplasmatota archaeon]